ncbi:unnamed protein product [Amoebophrya sp. A120]|nr:unnamed protein product [Amoebophrya sp. A120]|eukprot:GSA120T00010009001.1
MLTSLFLQPLVWLFITTSPDPNFYVWAAVAAAAASSSGAVEDALVDVETTAARGKSRSGRDDRASGSRIPRPRIGRKEIPSKSRTRSSKSPLLLTHSTSISKKNDLHGAQEGLPGTVARSVGKVTSSSSKSPSCTTPAAQRGRSTGRGPAAAHGGPPETIREANTKPPSSRTTTTIQLTIGLSGDKRHEKLYDLTKTTVNAFLQENGISGAYMVKLEGK